MIVINQYFFLWLKKKVDVFIIRLILFIILFVSCNENNNKYRKNTKNVIAGSNNIINLNKQALNKVAIELKKEYLLFYKYLKDKNINDWELRKKYKTFLKNRRKIYVKHKKTVPLSYFNKEMSKIIKHDVIDDQYKLRVKLLDYLFQQNMFVHKAKFNENCFMDSTTWDGTYTIFTNAIELKNGYWSENFWFNELWNKHHWRNVHAIVEFEKAELKAIKAWLKNKMKNKFICEMEKEFKKVAKKLFAVDSKNEFPKFNPSIY